MKKLLIIFLTLTFYVAFTQNSYLIYSSSKYYYTIEYSSSFVKRNIIGKNIDFKVVDNKGNSILVVVK